VKGPLWFLFDRCISLWFFVADFVTVWFMFLLRLVSCIPVYASLPAIWHNKSYVLNCCRDLPRISTVTISIYREADKKKKKDQHTLLGECVLCVSLSVVG